MQLLCRGCFSADVEENSTRSDIYYRVSSIDCAQTTCRLFIIKRMNRGTTPRLANMRAFVYLHLVDSRLPLLESIILLIYF